MTVYGWVMASLPEGKSRGSVFSAAVHTIWLYMLSPYHYKYKEAASLKVIGLLYSCLLIARLLSRSRMLNWHFETIYSNGIWKLSTTMHEQPMNHISPKKRPMLCKSSAVQDAFWPILGAVLG